jgi:hypothetical protein
MMGALRKRKDKPDGGGRKLPPEAFQYDDDVTPEVVKTIQEQADEIIRKEEWVVIDGYVGKKK